MDANGDAKDQELDPADYLFQTTKYHDRHITVGNPDTEQVEVFGVSTPHLVSQSTVFREMLVESELADRTGKNTHITDVSPEVFKLMLRHIYRGKFPAGISRETAAKLALCADKYNIQALVLRAAAMLVPTTVQDTFLALRSVVYINAPTLEKHVVTIIQEHTDIIIADKEFLILDPNCLEFIAKQEKLAVTELELWRCLLKWAKHQTSDPAEMRRLLDKPLRHLRFLTLTKDEIVEEVMPSKVLRAEESVELLLAVSGQLPVPLKIEGLCSIRQKRAGKESSVKSPQVVPIPNKMKSFKSSFRFDSKTNDSGTIPSGACLNELTEYAASSNFTIRTLWNEIELQSFTCKARRLEKANQPLYTFKCDIHMYTIINGFYTKVDSSTIEGQAIYNECITLPMVSKNSAFSLKPNTSYNFVLQFSSLHPVFTSNYKNFNNSTNRYEIKDSTYVEKKCIDLMSLKFNTPFHVQAIDMKY